MPVMQCSGAQACQRLISISAVPGGNPAAKADPEGYASEWARCSGCGSYTCDRCLSRQASRCVCGAHVRLLSEPERIAIATAMMHNRPVAAPQAAPQHQGPPQHRGPPQHQGPPQQGPVSRGGPMSAPGGQPPTPGPPLPAVLADLGQQLDGELSRGNQQRAAAMSALAATLMATQGPTSPPGHLAWLMSFGESFYRWRFYADGAEYWKGIYQLIHRLGRGESDEGIRAVATAGCFQVLGGLLAPNTPQAKQVLSLAERAFGAGHVLVRDVASKVGAVPPASGAGWGGGAPPVNMGAAPPRASSGAAALDPSSRLGLWVTLAFFDIAAADGKVADAEYLAWKNTMAKMKLPDVWERFGAQGIVDMLKRGVLQELSAEFASLPQDTRVQMLNVLVEFMMADGKMEPEEAAAVRRIGGWIGLTVQIG
jgi:uncharacterized tellurite resistance protein B-like protein